MDWRRPLMSSRGRYALLAAAIPVASLVAALVVHYGYGDHDDLIDAWWWALIHLVDPGSLGDDFDWPTRLVGLGLVLTGVVVLAGLVVTVVADAVDGALTRLGAGSVPPGVRDHVVMVGWSPRLGDAVAALHRAGEVGAEVQARVVVLLDSHHLDDAEAIRAEVSAGVDVPGGRHRGGHEPVVVFAPLDDRGFAVARVAHARAVVLFPAATATAEPLVADVDTLQRALLVERHLRHHGIEAGDGPTVLVAITGVDALVAARGVLPRRVAPVVSTRIATALLRDGLHHAGWAHAVAEVMDPDGEAHVVVAPVEGAAGLRWDEVVARTSGILPLGIARPGREPVVAPAPDVRMAEGDALVAVAPDDRPLRIGDAAVAVPIGPAALPAAQVDRAVGDALRVLTVGWSEVAATLVAELAEQRTVDHVVVNLASVSTAQRLEAVDDGDAAAVGLRLVEGSTTDRARLAEVVAEVAPHAVVVHGASTHGPRPGSTSGDGIALEPADAAAVVALLHLLDLVGPDTSVQADIVDAGRARLFLPGRTVGFVDTARLFTSAVAWMASDGDAVDVFGTVFEDPAILPTAIRWSPDARPDGDDGSGGEATVEGVAAGLAASGAALFGLVEPDGRVRLVPEPGELVPPGTVLLVVQRGAAGDGSTDRRPTSTAVQDWNTF